MIRVVPGSLHTLIPLLLLWHCGTLLQLSGWLAPLKHIVLEKKWSWVSGKALLGPSSSLSSPAGDLLGTHVKGIHLEIRSGGLVALQDWGSPLVKPFPCGQVKCRVLWHLWIIAVQPSPPASVSALTSGSDLPLILNRVRSDSLWGHLSSPTCLVSSGIISPLLFYSPLPTWKTNHSHFRVACTAPSPLYPSAVSRR